MTLQRPKPRGTVTAFASRLLGKSVTRTNALESLMIAGFVRGLSVRDVEASLADVELDYLFVDGGFLQDEPWRGGRAGAGPWA